MHGPSLKQELTRKQYEIVGLLALGWNLPEISKYIGRTHKGLRMELGRIHGRAGTSDKLEIATRFAWERKLQQENPL